LHPTTDLCPLHCRLRGNANAEPDQKNRLALIIRETAMFVKRLSQPKFLTLANRPADPLFDPEPNRELYAARPRAAIP
jgi:hypothetical protein